MTRAIVALLSLAALVAWLLRREPMPTATLWSDDDEPGGGWG